MSKDEIAISENKTCASKTKSYACKSKNCAKLHAICGLRVRKFQQNWRPKNAHNVLKIILD